jgi:hypothetical protein
MPVVDQVGVGLMLGAVFWVALFGGALIVGALAYFLFGPPAGEIGRERVRDRDSAGGTIELPQPAEEGGQLDEWGEDRLDRAA